MLAEATTTELSKKESPTTFYESKQIAVKGGTVAGNTRKDIEKQLGESIVTPKNAKDSLVELSTHTIFQIEDKKKNRKE